MKNIFLAPRSGEQSSGNFQKTIENGYKKQDLMPYLEELDREALGDRDVVFIWGNRPGGKSPWGKMQKDDYVFFYQHGKITWIGELLYKTNNKKLADALWGPYVSKGINEYWEYVYFLDNLVKVEIDYSVLRNLAGYKPNAVVQGFQSYRENGITGIVNKYGSIEGFINKHRVDQQGTVDNDKVNKVDAVDKKTKEIKMNAFCEYLKQNNLYFDPTAVKNFILALKTKPFVILTGNSGTGKTKLAQMFAQWIAGEEADEITNTKEIETTVNYTENAINNSLGWTLNKETTAALTEKEDFFIEAQIAGIKAEKCKVRYLNQFLYNSDANKDVISDAIREKYQVGDEIPVTLYLKTVTSLKRYQLVPVGADWTDKRHLLGFYNVITQKYQTTQVLDLMLAAHYSPSKPFFLILDEMNLSHVERYFADFLSALESGEKIPLHSSNSVEIEQGIPKELVIPNNLYVIGTVNVDETTYMFSPKVLDRANVLEFKTFRAIDYLSGNYSRFKYFEDIKFPDLEERVHTVGKMLEILKDVYISDRRARSVTEKLKHEINSFQQVLRIVGFDFGFRVVNEIIRYMYIAWLADGKQPEWKDWDKAFDAQITQKMLPKIHGSQKVLRDILKCLYCYCFAKKTDVQLDQLKKGNNVKELWETGEEKARYQNSAQKLKSMQTILDNQRYVTFTR